MLRLSWNDGICVSWGVCGCSWIVACSIRWNSTTRCRLLEPRNTNNFQSYELPLVRSMALVQQSNQGKRASETLGYRKAVDGSLHRPTFTEGQPSPAPTIELFFLFNDCCLNMCRTWKTGPEEDVCVLIGLVTVWECTQHLVEETWILRLERA
jgi:hypothetical protein